MIIFGIAICILMATGIGFDWLYEKVPGLREYLPETETTSVQATLDPTANNTAMPNTEQVNSDVTPEFKEMMDGYEEFFDSYIEFMEGYDSNNNTGTQLAKYSEMMIQYYETMEAIDKIDESALSEADEQYQIEVMLRINQKLATLASKQ